MLKRLFGRSGFSDRGLELYRACVLQGRQAAFYRDFGVPDSLDGRFDLIALHVFLAMRRLKAEGERSEALAQELSEIFFADMDVNLRELGASDIGVGRRVKRMIEGFYGRALAYDSALAEGRRALAEALARNLYGTVAPAAESLAAMADYVARADRALAAEDWESLSQGRLPFPLPAAADSDGEPAA